LPFFFVILPDFCVGSDFERYLLVKRAINMFIVPHHASASNYMLPETGLEEVLAGFKRILNTFLEEVHYNRFLLKKILFFGQNYPV